MTFTDWSASVKALGGNATRWPFDDDHNGEPAAMFPNAAYVAAFNTGHVPAGEGTRAANNQQYVYVLATAMTGSDEVLGGQPHVMTAAERVENAAFTYGDEAATAVGLPSLDSIQTFIKDTGKQIVVGLIVTVAISQLLRSRRR